ncbi:hypothetical protein CGRA01v4_02242 [Colletotrichum graminicola]|nr:hypothetical protein CGRA01v4_02242 [Colletotrichum graminicola]
MMNRGLIDDSLIFPHLANVTLHGICASKVLMQLSLTGADEMPDLK